MPDRHIPNEWPVERTAAVEALWQAGELSASAIGARLGITKNAVMGKVHRLGLARRRATPSGPPKKERAEFVFEQLGDDAGRLQPTKCRWIDGDVRKGTAVVCGAPVEPGTSYCATHYKLAVTRRVAP